MKPRNTVLTAPVLIFCALGSSTAAAGEPQGLRKGQVPPADHVFSPKTRVPQIERRAAAPSRRCDDPAAAKTGAKPPRGRLVPLSSYEDDPFAGDWITECLGLSQFTRVDTGRSASAPLRLLLANGRVAIQDEPVIYRQHPVTGEFLPFANNPWPEPVSNDAGNFLFPNEPRFPRHEIERDANGRPVRDENGLQIWKPRDIRIGMNVAFEAANAVRDAAEHWSGRAVRWGPGGSNRLEINAHAFIDVNAFFSPSATALFFGVAPYRLPGETGIQAIKMFETASSWEVVAHEAGHAVHAALKPNRDPSYLGYKTWSESFSDQMSMWAALRDPSRVDSLLAETRDFTRSNPLSAFFEAYAGLSGVGAGLRDAVHDRRISDTPPDVHDRSEVLTGAAYKLFLDVLNGIKAANAREALMQAGDIMGVFLTRATDYTPENTMTLEDVGKAYLKMDKELFGGRYSPSLVEELTRREIFGPSSIPEWLAHEATIPDLRLRPGAGEDEIRALIQANLAALGIGSAFGLHLQSVTRDRRMGQTVVRVQLTVGRGADAAPLENHGILTFRQNGTLADYHGPIPAPESRSGRTAQTQDDALALIARAKQLGLDRHGAPLSLVRRPDGGLTVEARVIRGSGKNTYAEVYSLDKPHGERRSIVTPLMPQGKSGQRGDLAHE